MTTLTELRQHPVEIIAFMNLIGLSTGIVFGVMTYAFGPGVRPFTLFNGNLLLMAFLVTYGHLRHSHMWIAFTGLAGHILQTAHHQLHHSVNPADYDRNFGFALAVWDWAFGTLVIPARAREPLVFGVGADAPPFPSALAAFVVPCPRFAGHIRNFAVGWVRRAAAGGVASAAEPRRSI
jgi:sterol desaturase/sphingolipid hydroxylase (fatty acid hydroxylase superfamily)